MKSAIVVSALVLLCLSLGFSPAIADQNDPRLDSLFAQLRETREPLQLNRLESEIWSIWTDSGEAEVNALMNEGIVAMRAQNYDLALAKFDQIIERRPDFAEGWNKRATVYYLREQLPESMRDVQRTLALEPRHFGALSGMGLIFMQSGDKQAAINAFQEVLNVHPHSVSAKTNIERLRETLRDQII